MQPLKGELWRTEPLNVIDEDMILWLLRVVEMSGLQSQIYGLKAFIGNEGGGQFSSTAS